MPRRLHHAHGRSRTERRPSLFTPGFMPTAGFAYPGYGILRFTMALAFVLIAGTVGAAHPLKPPNTSSPRATFESFLALTEEAASRYHAFRDVPSPATQEALWQISEKAARLFDLSQVAPAARPKVADETFYRLWDVIARLELPDLDKIPSEPVVQEGVEEADQPMRWRIPDTEITIVRITKGEPIFRNAGLSSLSRRFCFQRNHVFHQQFNHYGLKVHRMGCG